MTTDVGNRRPSSSIVSARVPKMGNPVLPQEPNEDKILVARQWLLAVRRFVRKALDRSDYAIREIEGRLYPTIRHVEGCPALDNDEVHCLQDTYRVEHADGCPAASDDSKFCGCPRVKVSDGCPDREQRMTLRCILEGLVDLTEQAPVRKFSADEVYFFPTRDGYTAMVVEIEYLRERLAELDPGAAPRLGAPETDRTAAEQQVQDEIAASAEG